MATTSNGGASRQSRQMLHDPVAHLAALLQAVAHGAPEMKARYTPDAPISCSAVRVVLLASPSAFITLKSAV